MTKQKLSRSEQVQAYIARQAELNGITPEAVSSQFSVEPSVQQTLYDRLQLSSKFLSEIHFVYRTEQSGETLGLEAATPVASTTKTGNGNKRKTTDIASLVSQTYKCEQINFDTHISYARLDAWAKFDDFQLRISNAKAKRVALDLIMMGMNGISRAENSNRNKNPLLQDVAKGWLQKIRENAPERVMGANSQGDNNQIIKGKVLVGKGQDYANLDAVVFDATNNLIDEVYQEGVNLVAIVGRKLLADKYFPIVNQDNNPENILAADMVISQKRIGNLPAVRVPYFPANSVLITTLENLAIYIQESAMRAHIQDTPDEDCTKFFQSDNIDYVVEDYRCAALIENITLEDKAE